MTNQEQQIALCEWMGWKRISRDADYDWISPNKHYSNNPPDTSSLDVLHEMEKKLLGSSDRAWSQYVDEVQKLTTDTFAGPETRAWMFLHADAKTRREALLRTIGKWRE